MASVGGILGSLLEIWRIFSSGMSSVFSFLNAPLRDILVLDVPIVKDVLNFVLDTLNVGDYTLLGLMFGAGISTLIIITVVKWLVDIVT